MLLSPSDPVSLRVRLGELMEEIGAEVHRIRTMTKVPLVRSIRTKIDQDVKVGLILGLRQLEHELAQVHGTLQRTAEGRALFAADFALPATFVEEEQAEVNRM